MTDTEQAERLRLALAAVRLTYALALSRAFLELLAELEAEVA